MVLLVNSFIVPHNWAYSLDRILVLSVPRTELAQSKASVDCASYLSLSSKPRFSFYSEAAKLTSTQKSAFEILLFHHRHSRAVAVWITRLSLQGHVVD